jgi:hypothetical protein
MFGHEELQMIVEYALFLALGPALIWLHAVALLITIFVLISWFERRRGMSWGHIAVVDIFLALVIFLAVKGALAG